MELKVKINTAILESKIKRLSRYVDDTKPALRNAGLYMIRETDKNFKGEKEPSGKKWESLDPDTIVARFSRGNSKRGIKDKHGNIIGKKKKVFKVGKGGKVSLTKGFDKFTSQAKILQDQGNLRKSIDVLKTTDKFVRIGTNLEYAAMHQFGSKKLNKPRMNIPARKFIGFNRKNIVTILDIFDKHIEKSITKAQLK